MTAGYYDIIKKAGLVRFRFIAPDSFVPNGAVTSGNSRAKWDMEIGFGFGIPQKLTYNEMRIIAEAVSTEDFDNTGDACQWAIKAVKELRRSGMSWLALNCTATMKIVRNSIASQMEMHE